LGLRDVGKRKQMEIISDCQASRFGVTVVDDNDLVLVARIL
jgi:hypothetical protein